LARGRGRLEVVARAEREGADAGGGEARARVGGLELVADVVVVPVGRVGARGRAVVGDRRRGLVDRVELAGQVAVAGARAAELVAGGVDDRVVVDQVE